MDDVMSDADYNTTYDLSGRSYNVTDKQGKGTNAQAELEVFAADVLNAFGSKLGLQPVKVNTDMDRFIDYNNGYNDHTLAPSTEHIIENNGVGNSSITYHQGVTQAYPVMGEANTYSMDQLKYNLFLQLTQALFKDADDGIQGDHAATLLGNRLNDRGSNNSYLTITLDPHTGSTISTAYTYVTLSALNDQAANAIKSANYTSKLDNNNGSSADLTDLQNKVDQARTDLQKAEAAVKQAEATKTAADQKLSDAKQAQNDAEAQLSQADRKSVV